MLPLNINVVKSILAGFIAFAIVYILGFEGYFIFISLIMMVCIYAMLLLIFGGLDEYDVIFLKIIEEKIGIKSKRLRRLIRRFI